MFAGDGSHLSCGTHDVVVAFAFYNVDIINETILGRNWKIQKNGTQHRLKEDIANIFRADAGMQCLFICEFGQMSPIIDVDRLDVTADVLQFSTQEYFEQLVHAMPRYVALIDSTVWQ